MLKRRKRIQYDPPGQRRKNRRAARRADQVYMTRRSLLLKGSIVGGFAVLVSRLGYMQLLKGDYYSERTANSTTRWKVEKPTRGLLIDRAGRTLAENRRVWEVRVTPADLPDEGTPEFDLVRNSLITALRLPDVLVIDPAAVPAGAEETVFRRVASLLGVTAPEEQQSLIDVIAIRSKYNYLVEIDEFTDSLAPIFRAASQELPGVSVVNRFDYLITNTAVPELPVLLKRDVSREIAMTLEANRLYMPGVELNDSAFVRSYPAGETMSHVLGYVGPVIDEERTDPANLTPGGQPYYEYDDTIGKLGLELWMEKVLRGSRGGRFVEVDGVGVESRLLYENPAVPGRNVKLSIDLELQAAATRALAEGIAFSNEDRTAKDAAADKPYHEYKAGAGAAVVVDVRSGEVLALASYPLYDNQLFVEGISVRKYAEYTQNVNSPLVNKAAADHFPPGSTLKLFMAMAGLRENVINANTSFTCTGGIWVPYTWDESKGDRYLCWQHAGGGHGVMDLVTGIEQSCDVYFYNVGTPEQKPEGAKRNLHYRDLYYDSGDKGELHYFQGLGIQKIHRQLTERFWFGEPTGIELPFEASGLVPDPEWKLNTYSGDEGGWSAGDTINASIGQGFFLATPLQLAVNTAAIANGGTIYRPRLIREIVDDKGKTQQVFPAEALRKLKVSNEHLDLVREGMWRVVNSEMGTANRSYNADTGQFVTKWPMTNPDDEDKIVIAGKTGTAEVGAKREDGTYADAHGWFTCYAPFDDPQVAVTVFLKEGGEGSSYAVPVADKVLRAYFELTGQRDRGMMLSVNGVPVEIGAEPELETPDATPQASPGAVPRTPVPVGDGTGT